MVVRARMGGRQPTVPGWLCDSQSAIIMCSMLHLRGTHRITRAAVALGLLGLSLAAAALPAGAGASSGSEPRASAIDPGLGAAGLIVLSCGIGLLGLSRVARPVASGPPIVPRATRPATLAATSQPVQTAGTLPTPLAAIASALDATAGALLAISAELGEPAATTVAREAMHVREAAAELRRPGDGRQ